MNSVYDIKTVLPLIKILHRNSCLMDSFSSLWFDFKIMKRLWDVKTVHPLVRRWLQLPFLQQELNTVEVNSIVEGTVKVIRTQRDVYGMSSMSR